MSSVTIKQIAEALGRDRSVITKRAKKEAWPLSEAKGKQRLFVLETLPGDVFKALAIAEPSLFGIGSKESAPKVPKAQDYDRDALWSYYNGKSDKEKARPKFRLKVLRAWARLVDAGIAPGDAFKTVGQEFGKSHKTIAGWYYGTNGKPGAQHYDRADWEAALMPGYVGRKPTAECTPEAWDYLKGQWLRPEKPNVATVYYQMQKIGPERGWVFPPLRTLQRWVDQYISDVQKTLHREGQHALMLKSPSQRRTVRDLWPMAWINGDGYQHNVFVRWPDGTVGRPKTWFWQDVYSRRILAWQTDHSENSGMILTSLAQVLRRYGIPEDATIDNTRAVANKCLTGGVKNRYRGKVTADEPDGVFRAIDTEVHWTSIHYGKGHGQAKPIERLFGIGGMDELVDKQCHGAYTGKNTSDKPDNYGDAVVSLEYFEQKLAQGVATMNAIEGRRTEMAAGKYSFDQVFDDGWKRTGHQVRQPTAEQLQMCLLMVESVTVQKDATVELSAGKGPLGKNRYSCHGLMNWIGKKVAIRFDPSDLHGTVHVYQLDGKYLFAAECIQDVGFGDQSASAEFARQRKNINKAAKDKAEAENRMSALEARTIYDALEPDEQPVSPATDHNVRRGDFRPLKRVANGDDHFEHNFIDQMERMRPAFLENHPLALVRSNDDED